MYSFSQETEEPVGGARISFEEASFDFGDIIQGDKVEHIFFFENVGNEPLILSDVRTTCGCTVPEWPKEPIIPGQKTKIKVLYNSTGKMGMQTKVITVLSNSVSGAARVRIMANVLATDPNH